MARATDPLKEYRDQNGLTQQELADKLNVSRGLVSMLEIGIKKYTAEMAVLIEKRIGIPREKFRPDLFRRIAA